MRVDVPVGEIEMEVIKAENLTFAYKNGDENPGKNVLENIDFTIEKGSFVAILGHNGSGKSTLAKHFNALIIPDVGTMTVFGMDTRNEDLLLEIRKRTGLVFQNPDNQIVANVVEEDVAFAPENLGCPPEEIRRRVDNALEIVGMSEFATHAPHLLSGGQKQRIAIAGVLAMQPECIVFDEATAMLDPKGRRDVLNIIRLLKEELNTTVILITHHMNEAALADRVIVMSDGKVIMDDVPKKVFSQVERLREIGLDVPAGTRLIYELNKCGFDIPIENLTAEECADAIFKAVNEETGVSL